MAKRRRLTPAVLETTPGPADGESDSRVRLPFGTTSAGARPPVAQIAGQAAERAALEEISRSIATARGEGRLAEPLPLNRIVENHLVRDRAALDADELSSLEASLASRGQQTPIEVVALEDGRFGLISGLRRVTALRNLGAQTVLAVTRRPEGAAEAYQAMVEENEIRVGLTYWERARIALRATELGVFPDVAAAIACLFAHGSRAKRSKIGSFATLVETFDSALAFPTAVPERTGLALAATLSTPGFAAKLCDALRKAQPETAEAERAILDRALRKGAGQGQPTPKAKPSSRAIASGISLESRQGRLVLTGEGVNASLVKDLAAWLAAR